MEELKCISCGSNIPSALNTLDTVAFVKERNVVTLMADWTDRNDEIGQWLDRFQVPSVPLTVIVPADPKQDLIVLNGLYTKGQLLERLNEAVPVKAAAGPGAAAMPVAPQTAMAEPGEE